MKKTTIALFTMFLAVLVLAGCSSNKDDSASSKTLKSGDLASTTYKKSQSYYRNGTTYSGKKISLDFKNAKYETRTIKSGNKTIKYRAYENIVYVSKPVDKKYQKMNIYIPEAYFKNKKLNGYTKKTAPVFLPNSIGGYMPGEPTTIGGSTTTSTAAAPAATSSSSSPAAPGAGGTGVSATGGAPQGQNSAPEKALKEGYIVAAPGARGRTTKANGKYTGKAPAAIVDLKAAVRYLKLNSKKIPGNENKIISDGTSAGGAISGLLGASGNAKDYAPYLKAIGAADTSDNIFASMDFCPIMNLENADAAYEWQFNGINDYVNGMHMPGETPAATTLTSAQKKISKDLKKEFPDYVNGLKLKDDDGNTLKMNSDGSGSFNNLIKQTIIDSAQTAIDNGKNITEKKYPFLTIKNKKVTDVNLKKYNKAVGRMKPAPAFDGVDLSNAENQEMGTATVNKKHFTDYSQENNTAKNKTSKASSSIIKMMNPMDFVGENNADTAQHWYIRYGEKDANTSIAVPTIFAQKLKNENKDVNYHLEWGKGHAGDYNLNEMFKWMNKISK
ncbi:subtype B tannase [Companilactobacillus furfuricola]|uniref:subtype B tannase n=1 Tax=Companilactobacillus furfuricola TaxID=1462575 RepID=UPI000F7873D4|nr:subtype B tannase [Companilactobacillus furfuricola]